MVQPPVKVHFGSIFWPVLTAQIVFALLGCLLFFLNRL